jgi:hypothetical protein
MFKIIKEFPKYSINKNGDVKNNKSDKIRKPRLRGKENAKYLSVNLMDNNNKIKHICIHKLLALTFIPNPNNYKIIDHIDRNKLNNNINNLRWTTISDNSINKPVIGKLPYRHIYLYKNVYRISIERINIKFWKTYSQKKYTLEYVVNERNKQYEKLGIKIDDLI